MEWETLWPRGGIGQPEHIVRGDSGWIAAGSSGLLLFSSNSEDWKTAALSGPGRLPLHEDILRLKAQEGVYLAMSSECLYSSNDGQNWYEVDLQGQFLSLTDAAVFKGQLYISGLFQNLENDPTLNRRHAVFRLVENDKLDLVIQNPPHGSPEQWHFLKANGERMMIASTTNKYYAPFAAVVRTSEDGDSWSEILSIEANLSWAYPNSDRFILKTFKPAPILRPEELTVEGLLLWDAEAGWQELARREENITTSNRDGLVAALDGDIHLVADTWIALTESGMRAYTGSLFDAAAVQAFLAAFPNRLRPAPGQLAGDAESAVAINSDGELLVFTDNRPPILVRQASPEFQGSDSLLGSPAGLVVGSGLNWYLFANDQVRDLDLPFYPHFNSMEYRNGRYMIEAGEQIWASADLNQWTVIAEAGTFPVSVEAATSSRALTTGLTPDYTLAITAWEKVGDGWQQLSSYDVADQIPLGRNGGFLVRALGDRFVMLGNGVDDSAFAAWSDDGLSWQAGTLPEQAIEEGFGFGNSLFVSAEVIAGRMIAMTQHNQVFLLTEDGMNWELFELPEADVFNPKAMIREGGWLIAGGYNSGIWQTPSQTALFITRDGISWTCHKWDPAFFVSKWTGFKGDLFLRNWEGAGYYAFHRLRLDPFLADAEEVIPGWRNSPRMGWFYDEKYPWVWMMDGEWCYVYPDSSESYWMYGSQSGWMWVHCGWHPWVWMDSLKQWQDDRFPVTAP